MKRNFWRTTKNEKNIFKILEKINSFAVLDCETTGLSPDNDRIIELAVRKIEVEKIGDIYVYKETSNKDFYICPPFLVSDKIEELTSITNEFLTDKPKEEDIFDEIKEYLGNNIAIIGHNVNFDMGFINNMYSRYGEVLTYVQIDTLDMARDLFEKNIDLPNHKLGTVAGYYNWDGQFHLAINDTLATAHIFIHMLNEYMEREKISSAYRESTTKEIAKINNISAWENWCGKLYVRRIYVNTDKGTCYFDRSGQQWHDKEKNGDFLERIDMDRLQKDVFTITGCNSLEELRGWESA